MKLLKSKVTLLFLLAVMFLLPDKIVRAADVPDRVQKEMEYETTDPEDKKVSYFPERFEQDGVVYVRDHVNYRTVKETPVKEKKSVFVTKKSGVIRDAEQYAPQKILKENGLTYQLVQTSKKKKTLEKGYLQKVTGYSEYDTRQSAQNAAMSKKVKTKNPRTGETIYVSCKKKGNVKRTADIWVNTYIDIVFVSYDAEHFIWNGVLVKKNTEEPLKGYHKELLQSVGGSSRNYKIQRISWMGDSYQNKKGVLCRKAKAYVRKKMPHYRVNYSGTRTVKAVKGTVYTSLYAGEEETYTDKINYTVLATATYQAQKNSIPVVTITLGIIAAILVVVGILFFLFPAKRKKRQVPEHR